MCLCVYTYVWGRKALVLQSSATTLYNEYSSTTVLQPFNLPGSDRSTLPLVTVGLVQIDKETQHLALRAVKFEMHAYAILEEIFISPFAAKGSYL